MIFEVLVALGQALHDVAERAEREALVQRVGIERVEVALKAYLKVLAAAGVAARASAIAPATARVLSFI